MSPGPEDEVSQAEKRRIIREQASTFHQHAQAQADETAQGRFRAIGTPRVVGSMPNPSSQYPAASAAHQTALPDEPPLGFSVNDLEPSTNQLAPPVAVEEPGPASRGDAPSDHADALRAKDAGPLSHKRTGDE